MPEYEIFNYDNLADKEDITDSFSELAETYYNGFKSDREQWEDVWEVADYMRKAAINRTVNATEDSKGMDLPSDDNRSQTGSTMFYRYINQFAALGYSIQSSAEEPFQFAPLVNFSVDNSPGEAKDLAKQKSVLSKWIRQRDGFDAKSIEFWDQLGTYGNVPIMIHQEYEEGTRKRRIPKYETVIDDMGHPTNTITDYEEKEDTFIVKNYPSFTVLSNDNVYMDPYIGNVQSQNCVVLASVRSKGDIGKDAQAGNFDEKQFEKLDKNMAWDGSAGSEFRQKKLENADLEFNPSSSEHQFLQWDVYMRAPISGSSWKEDEIPELYWGTFIGNTLKEAICMRLIRNPDPDDEIPMAMVHVNPDDSNMLYHLSPAEIIRSNYSVECTLKNLALDNMGLVCNPPLMAVEGMHSITDFEYKKGQLWNVMTLDAVKEFQTRDITQNINALLDYIKNDSFTALNLDKVMAGESQGARTSASEAISINRNSMQPHLVQTKYILEQFLGFYARKSISYMTYFAHPDQILHITDEPQIPEINPSELHGEFDVIISIVDDYEESALKQQFIAEAIRIIGSSPALMESQTHRIDVGEMLKEWFQFAHFDASKIIQPLSNSDAESVAKNENIAMIMNGQYVEPNPNENKPVHLSIHKADEVRYQGLEEEYPGIALLKQHIAATEQGAEQAGVNNLPTGTGNATEGQAVGNQMAGALGGGVM